MTKNQELQVLLWKNLGGIKMTFSVWHRVKNSVGEKVMEDFQFIYDNPKLNILLALKAKTRAEYEDFWKSELSELENDDEVIDFLLSEDYAEILYIWRRCLLEKTVAKSSSEQLKALCRALWNDMEDTQIRMYISYLIASLQGIVPMDDFTQSVTILTMFADKVAEVDISSVSAIMAKYKLLLNLL